MTEAWSIQKGTCYVNCCSRDLSGNCLGCINTCYNGFVFATIANIAQHDLVSVVSNANTALDVQILLQNNYPIGGSFKCFYQNGLWANSSAVPIQINMNNATSSYIAGLFFLSAAAFILLIWIIIEICYNGQACVECISDGCSNCARNARNSRKARLDRKRIRDEQKAEQKAKVEGFFFGGSNIELSTRSEATVVEQEERSQQEELRQAVMIPPNSQQPPASAPPAQELGLRDSEVGIKKTTPTTEDSQTPASVGWWSYTWWSPASGRGKG